MEVKIIIFKNCWPLATIIRTGNNSNRKCNCKFIGAQEIFQIKRIIDIKIFVFRRWLFNDNEQLTKYGKHVKIYQITLQHEIES